MIIAESCKIRAAHIETLTEPTEMTVFQKYMGNRACGHRKRYGEGLYGTP
ncbi:hypothetical protein KQI61_15835 [Anaerocolumna aminovalerica]|nr:hypothetical protein [Anaerocolumna aminovalerica]MBU5333670.1 hypothetical protein [Anaerocolumna aminovalerica]